MHAHANSNAMTFKAQIKVSGLRPRPNTTAYKSRSAYTRSGKMWLSGVGFASPRDSPPRFAPPENDIFGRFTPSRETYPGDSPHRRLLSSRQRDTKAGRICGDESLALSWMVEKGAFEP